MTVAAILKEKGNVIHTAHPHQSLNEAACTLREYSIGAVVITDGGGQPVGVLSERDIVRALADHGATVMERPISDFMTSNVITGLMHQSADEVMENMTRFRIRHLPIVEDDVLVGIVSIGDVVRVKIESIEAEAEALKSYIAS